MRTFEIVIALVLFAFGVRSMLYWLRRPVEGTDVGTHLAFAAFVLGRVGLWWSLAGFFVLSATLRNPDPWADGALLAGGKPFIEEFRARYWWYPLVVIGFAVMGLVASVFLSRRPDPGPGPGSDPGPTDAG